MDADLRVGIQRVADGSKAVARGGNQGELCSNLMNGKYFEQMLRGNVFLYHVDTQAVLISAPTAANVAPTVINPMGSGVLFVPLVLRIGYTAGNTTISSLLLAETLNVAGAPATGGPILVATFVNSKNARRGGGRGKCLYAPTTCTFTAAPTVIASTGLNLGALAPTGSGTYEVDFDGAYSFEPGTAVSVVCSVATTTATFHLTLFGLEVPLPLTA